MWGSLIGGAVGALGSFFGGREEAKVNKQGMREGLKRIDASQARLADSTLADISSRGAEPYNAVLGLLGVPGGAPGAGAGYDQFLDSSGYRAQMDAGNQAIQANLSARGMRNSGAAMKEAARFGQGLGAQYFNNYISQLMGASQQGISAATNMANIDASLAGGGANVAQTGAARVGSASGNAISDMAGIAGGTIREIWG